MTKLFKTKATARKWEVEKRGEKDSMIPSVSLGEAYTEYLEIIQIRHSKKTFQEKHFLGKRIVSQWGNINVISIDPSMIQTLLTERALDVSNNAANKDRKNLHAFFKWIRTKGIVHNPVHLIDRFPHERHPQRVPTDAEVLRLLAVAAGQDKVMLLSYLHTAARKGEVVRWRWDEDINFEKRMVRLGTKKNRTGEMEYEWLPMNDVLYDALWRHYQTRKKQSPWVFTNLCENHQNYGQRYTERYKWMKTLCKRAKMKSPFGVHALRRYVATVLADTHKRGTKSIQRVLRHRNFSTTEKYIGNVNRDLEETLRLLEANLHEDLHESEVKRNGQ